MKVHRLLFLPLVVFLVSLTAYAQDSGANDDKEQIRAAIEGYVAAINDGNAAAAAAHWSDSGEWISPQGDRIRGRASIQQEMEKSFAEGGGPQVELVDLTVRFLTETVAMEEGHAVVTYPGQPPHKSSYVSVHVKTDAGWKLDSVRETKLPSVSSNYENLKELEWMIGTWVDEGENSVVTTSCEWTTNQNFLLCTFSVSIDSVVDLEGTQVIGWDAKQKTIRSWVFDSDGGFGSGVWSSDGKTWTAESTFQLPDGGQGSSTNHYTYVNPTSFMFESVNRQVDGESLPDIPRVSVKKVQDNN